MDVMGLIDLEQSPKYNESDANFKGNLFHNFWAAWDPTFQNTIVYQSSEILAEPFVQSMWFTVADMKGDYLDTLVMPLYSYVRILRGESHRQLVRMGRTTAENPQPSDLRERGTYRSTQFIKGMKAERSLMGLISANPVAILPVHIEKMFHQIRVGNRQRITMRVNTLRLISSVTTLSTVLHRCVRDYSTEFCKYELVCERKTEFDGLRHMQSTFDKAARVVSKISF
ncbi:hypothetical protein T4D_8560 [Trichinella pseudospiralis]|uniref:Uncharacterized protein n=1 Tax=Trichinella pseudospiralis TaxID=6337 RepID=A0A0V1FM90_TRIPS|nr:hypothetical protein T4D_8560 [Trichinella pseudospiralis]